MEVPVAYEGQILRRDVLRKQLAPIVLCFRQGRAREESANSGWVQLADPGCADECQGGYRRMVSFMALISRGEKDG